MRLHKIATEYQGVVQFMERFFPLEIYGGGPPNRQEIEQEMWFAAMQEPEAEFKPFGDVWPTTTLPAFEAAWCAFQQGEAVGRRFDMRIRRAFFAEGRDIGQREVMLELAHEAGLDMSHFTHLFNTPEPRAAVLEEGRLGKEQYGVSATPTIMLPDGVLLHHPMAFPAVESGRITSVGRLPCSGEGCYIATRKLFEEAAEHVRNQT